MLQLRLTIVLGLLQAVCAIVVAVTLYATRDQDSDLAMLALIFVVGERLRGAISTRATHSQVELHLDARFLRTLMNFTHLTGMAQKDPA